MLIFRPRDDTRLADQRLAFIERFTPTNMKTCPQCQAVYEEDYVFCLMDGGALYDNDGETETVYKRSIPTPGGPMPATPFYCDSCGIENRSTSRFCKKCGAPIATIASGGGQPLPDPAIYTQQAVSAPPLQQNNSKLYAGIAVVAILLCVATVIGAVAFVIWSNSKQTTNSANGSPAANNTTKPTLSNRNPNVNKPANNANAQANTNLAAVVGRKGHLTTNQRIRVSSNRYSEVLGVHYRNAKVEILEVTSYMTEDGMSTWYRVRVLENGCDAEGKRGCGNDLNGVSGQAAHEGWMNAKFINLD